MGRPRTDIQPRIVRAARSLGIPTVLAASIADHDSMAAREADRTVVIGPAPARASYLDARLVVHAAKMTGCDGFELCLTIRNLPGLSALPVVLTPSALSDPFDAQVALDALSLFGVDEFGLDKIDRRILTLLCEQFAAQPVGLTTLAHACGEEPFTIEDAYEPYLLRAGLMVRTPRGRVATERAYEHLGIQPRHGGLF